MSTQVKLPELGDGIESGDVLEIFVKVGDVIVEGQDIIEMETDKATVPVPASVGGKVVKINVSEGDTIPIGGTILEVEAASGATTEPEPVVEPKPAAEPESKAPAATAADAPPAASEPPAPVPPKQPTGAAPEPVAKQPVAKQPVAKQPAKEQAAEKQAAASKDVSQPESDVAIAAGPAIRRFAREVGVDLTDVVGSGENGRITREDVLAVVRSTSQSARSKSRPAESATPADESPASASRGTASPSSAIPGDPDADDFGLIRVQKMSRIRKTIARQMHQSWSTVPRVTNFDDADITDLEKVRQSTKEDYAAKGLKLTTMPFLIKAVATALRGNPMLNAMIDEENESIIYKDYVNIGIAVDTDRGLVVPVLQHADRMSVPDLARSLAELAAKVREGKFSLSDLRGGTFSISNLGAIGGQYSTPVVNVPEVAILLVGRSRKLPVVMPNDSIEPRLMMPLSISYDHRLVDGATAARFLNDVIAFMEAPSRLLMAL